MSFLNFLRTLFEFKSFEIYSDGSSKKSKVVVYSDSRIVVDAMTKGDWPTSLRPEIEELCEVSKHHLVSWKWIKAHSGVRLNERCDELCIQARRMSLCGKS